MEKELKNPPGYFCQRVPIMHLIDSYSAGTKYHLTIEKPRMCAFLWYPDFGGFVARLQGRNRRVLPLPFKMTFVPSRYESLLMNFRQARKATVAWKYFGQ